MIHTVLSASKNLLKNDNIIKTLSKKSDGFEELKPIFQTIVLKTVAEMKSSFRHFPFFLCKKCTDGEGVSQYTCLPDISHFFMFKKETEKILNKIT
jgi:hypothetical protein